MNKETHKKLIKDFPKSVVKPAPKGKFGDYVPHHLYTQRLVDVIPGGYDYTYEIVRDKDNSIVGAKCKLYIKDAEQTIEEVGDVDTNALKRNITESEILKLAVSDGIKRCCMRLGIGLELWTGGTTEEEHYATASDNIKVETVPVVKPSKEQIKKMEDIANDMVKDKTQSQVLNQQMEVMIPDAEIRKTYKDKAWANLMDKGMSKKVNDWSDEDINTFLDEVGSLMDAAKAEGDDPSEDIVAVRSSTPYCPDCATEMWMEDNRSKKAEAPTDSPLSRIPDFSCSNFKNNNGCGRGWYISSPDSDKEVPGEWL
jgi:hypothetical protein